MSIHIGAKQGSIAETVLLPGDPLRAKYIAETYLSNVECYNEIRNMLGYTGTYKGKRLSVQGTGMGIPSFSIYATELIKEYQVKTLVRVGTCGAMQKEVEIGDVVLAQAASTDSSLIRNIFGSTIAFAPTADFTLLYKAYNQAVNAGLKVRAGNVISVDRFYDEEIDNDKLTDFGILAVDMETAALYTLASRYKARGLALLTVSDHLITGEHADADTRQTGFNDMIKTALETVTSLEGMP